MKDEQYLSREGMDNGVAERQTCVKQAWGAWHRLGRVTILYAGVKRFKERKEKLSIME